MKLAAYDHGADFAPSRYWSAPVPLDQAMTAMLGPGEIAIHVYANHGRWVVECPDCCGAQIASAVDYRFMCTVCANVAVEGLWRSVIWPEEYAEIDEALCCRENTANQNWVPGETLEELKAEEPAPEPEPTKARAR